MTPELEQVISALAEHLVPEACCKEHLLEMQEEVEELLKDFAQAIIVQVNKDNN